MTILCVVLVNVKVFIILSTSINTILLRSISTNHDCWGWSTVIHTWSVTPPGRVSFESQRNIGLAVCKLVSAILVNSKYCNWWLWIPPCCVFVMALFNLFYMLEVLVTFLYNKCCIQKRNNRCDFTIFLMCIIVIKLCTVKVYYSINYNSFMFYFCINKDDSSFHWLYKF